MLERKSTVLAVVDVQGKLAESMHDKESLFNNLRKLIQGIHVLGVPVLWTEQNPEGLGPTVPDIAELLADLNPIPKTSFSSWRNGQFARALGDLKRSNVLLAGIETHICIYQTAVDLLREGYTVETVADAVSSRTPRNREIGLLKIRDAGIALTSVETALFELLGTAKTSEFKDILRIVK
ncbi:MAG: hydrolase [Kiritimatiellia bacterium]